MSSESGFSTQKKVKEAQYKTIHGLGSDRFGSSISLKHLANIGAVKPLTNSLLSDDRNYVTLEIAAHTARIHDIIRVVSGAQALVEYEVVEILDPNILIVINAGQLVIPQIGDNVQLARWVTSSSDVTGTPATTAPVGGATEVKQDAMLAQLQAINQNQYLPVKSKANLDFSVNNVGNVAWVQLIANVGAVDIKKIEFFMSSGEPLEIAVGAPGAEVSQAYIIPGGNGFLDMENFPAGSRASVRAVNAVTVNAGQLIVNFMG